MLLLIKFLSQIFALFNGEVSKKQIGAGYAYGAIIGLMPVAGIFPLFLTLLSFIINFNLPAVGLAILVTKIQSFFVDPLSNYIGYTLLVKIPALKGFWTTLYNLPIVPYTKFNNTLVLGSFVFGVLSIIPNFFFMFWVVELYRTRFRDKVQQFKIVQIVKASSFYKYYLTFRKIKGE